MQQKVPPDKRDFLLEASRVGRLDPCVDQLRVVRRVRDKLSGMKVTLEYEREEDGRWLAEVPELPGVMAYGDTPEEAMRHAEVLALRVLARPAGPPTPPRKRFNGRAP